MFETIKQQVQNNGTNIIMFIVIGVLAFTMIRKMMSTASDDDIRKYIIEGNTLVIDVRSRAEYAGGSFPGAINIPHNEITPNHPSLPKDKSHKMIVFCASGMRSSTALGVLNGIGYSNVLNAGTLGNISRFARYKKH
ncbi:predicted protein [Naegleria gruberi]|uniref:Predicted protein n=1 Tax=Naegleria gruberi TaxID=5762 RepID=D2V3T3_NAEGR|nr:uncharacterized protein NAEGRDRAFT_63480 [Naegleria gruberi]EFC48410.1 predicted protein [Naegleria gruberi]|eukprot:XP_002681154.1 predicted protein [Naegleria gruberi strain NEG-M]